MIALIEARFQPVEHRVHLLHAARSGPWLDAAKQKSDRLAEALGHRQPDVIGSAHQMKLVPDALLNT